MIKPISGRRIFAYSGKVDMRKSFDGLVGITRNVLKEDPLSGDMYVYHNGRGNMIKILVWDRTGFVLYAKRLEQGRFKINSVEEKNIISEQQLILLLDGIRLGVR